MNMNENKMSSESQNAKILAWLGDGKTLTAMEALREFGCFRLASRIHDLRDRGWNIAKEMVTLHNGKRVARYSMAV